MLLTLALLLEARILPSHALVYAKSHQGAVMLEYIFLQMLRKNKF